MGNLNLKIEIDSLHKFYHESNNVTPYGNQYEWSHTNHSVDAHWVGLNKAQIDAHKYHYKPGLKNLTDIKDDVTVGGSKKTYKWDENDGDDMSMERYYEGMPAMRKRCKTEGTGTGRFVTIHCNISENCHVTHKEMCNKTAACVSIVDFLENLGYRVSVNLTAYSGNPGSYKGTHIDTLLIDVVIKKPEEMLNKPLLLTALSPWMFRHHMFKFWHANFQMRWGLGKALRLEKEDTPTDIYIDNGECLCEEDIDRKVKEIVKMFDKEN